MSFSLNIFSMFIFLYEYHYSAACFSFHDEIFLWIFSSRNIFHAFYMILFILWASFSMRAFFCEYLHMYILLKFLLVWRSFDRYFGGLYFFYDIFFHDFRFLWLLFFVNAFVCQSFCEYLLMPIFFFMIISTYECLLDEHLSVTICFDAYFLCDIFFMNMNIFFMRICIALRLMSLWLDLRWVFFIDDYFFNKYFLFTRTVFAMANILIECLLLWISCHEVLFRWIVFAMIVILCECHVLWGFFNE